MSEHVNTGEMVEGARCNIYTRKEEWKSMQRDPITHKPMVKYELSRNCSVEVTHKHEVTSSKDVELRANLPLYTEIGDKLKALCISVYIDQKKKLGDPVVETSSSRHEGRLFYTENRTIGVIKYPFDNLKTITQRYLENGSKQLTSNSKQ